jgi:hypothetical protein
MILLLCVCNFAECFSFILHDEVNSFHWNNAEAKIRPFVIYFKNADITLSHAVSFMMQ